MKKPVLVVMAAGMGSRYGGLKQIDPIDREGHIIIDFSIYDAVRAGFEKVVFIIKRENEKDFREAVGDRLSRQIEVAYVYQELTNLPEGVTVPEGRVKPWGTGHAVLCCMEEVDGPFAVINADDYYGRSAFESAYRFLTTHEDDEKYQYTMVGYVLANTLTENGYVSRGVCTVDEDGLLQKIEERTHIVRTQEGAAYSEDGGETYAPISPDSIVSMNMWGFSASILPELSAGFERFLKKGVAENPLKCEFYLPFAVEELLEEGKAQVTVCRSMDRWYGVTYKEDKPMVVEAIQRLKDEGVYPAKLWEA